MMPNDANNERALGANVYPGLNIYVDLLICLGALPVNDGKLTKSQSAV